MKKNLSKFILFCIYNLKKENLQKWPTKCINGHNLQSTDISAIFHTSHYTYYYYENILDSKYFVNNNNLSDINYKQGHPVCLMTDFYCWMWILII